MKTGIIFSVVLALLTFAFSSRAVAAGPSSCPAFTAGMLDATALQFILTDIALVAPSSLAADNPVGPNLNCYLDTAAGQFSVVVDGARDVPVAMVTGREFGGPVWVIHIKSEGITTAEVHACRSQVLQSFIWNQHCVPLLP